MTVKEMISELEKMDQEAKVLLASDVEGNSFSELGDICLDAMWNKGTGEVESGDDGDYPNFVAAVILFP